MTSRRRAAPTSTPTPMRWTACSPMPCSRSGASAATRPSPVAISSPDGAVWPSHGEWTTVLVAMLAAMTTSQSPDFPLTRPGVLIAALPAVLGFAPEKSLVLVTVDHGEMGCVMRVDLSDELPRSLWHIADVAAAAKPDSAIAVIIDGDGASCRLCNDDYRELAEGLTTALANRGIELLAAHVVDRVAAGGRWHCADGCGNAGTVEDPSASPMAMAAVLDGRRLYARRAEMQEVIEASDPARTDVLAEVIGGCKPGSGERPDEAARADIEAAIAAAARVADAVELANDELARL